MKKIVTPLALALFLAAPAAAQNREHLQMAAELRMIQEQQQQLALAVAQVAEAIKALHPRFDEQSKAISQRFASLELTLKNMGTDLSVMRERTQDNGTRLGRIADEIEALRSTLSSIPAMLTQLSQQQQPQPALPVDPNAPPQPAGVAPPPVSLALPPPAAGAGQSPNRMLDAAKSDYFSARYELAITGFDAVIKTFPTSEAAAEAQYFVGESYASQNRWTDAITAYETLIRVHAKSAFVPEAYYKLGIALERNGQLPAARAAWERAVKSYKDTDGGRLSQQSLDRTARQTPARP